MPYGSHWGCKIPTKLTTLITNKKNEGIFPDYSKASYSLPGYHSNSSELVFRILYPHLKVTAGEEFRIWYRQDLLDCAEFENAGQT